MSAPQGAPAVDVLRTAYREQLLEIAALDLSSGDPLVSLPETAAALADLAQAALEAALVIARDEVLGMTRPRAAAIETTIGVVRLPGSPPIECLSSTTGRFQVRRLPTSTMARVNSVVSFRSSGNAEQAVTNAARCASA